MEGVFLDDAFDGLAARRPGDDDAAAARFLAAGKEKGALVVMAVEELPVGL